MKASGELLNEGLWRGEVGLIGIGVVFSGLWTRGRCRKVHKCWSCAAPITEGVDAFRPVTHGVHRMRRLCLTCIGAPPERFPCHCPLRGGDNEACGNASMGGPPTQPEDPNKRSNYYCGCGCHPEDSDG